jgi:hypothetical protein
VSDPKESRAFLRYAAGSHVEISGAMRSRRTISVSDGRQPPLTFKLQVSQTAASRSLDALVSRTVHQKSILGQHAHTAGIVSKSAKALHRWRVK